MIGALAALVAGLIVLVFSESIAVAVLRTRTDAQRHGSLLNTARTDRTNESFNNPRARRLEVWLVRGVGVAAIAGGVIALAS